MTKLLFLATAAGMSILSAPALAQNSSAGPAAGGGERVNQVIVYGDDPCPQAEGDEIVVCGRMAEDERYRIPEPLRGNPNDPRRESWTARVQSVERIGRTGTDSCTPVGLGGFTGCVDQMVNNAMAERRQAAGMDWTNAVAEERRRRMEGFDAEANEVEAQIARDEAARIAREQAAAEAAERAEEEAAGVDNSPLPMPQSAPRPPQG
ncbi:hypothetical protein [Sphingomonas lacunae]|uniref:hypothetical protein n=1 Tax=Sphingomonas lacunae TaxID=2698828 RepID=UPI001BB0D630|nr:hypothetical protein [Sphingomonas lacunae]